MIDVRKARLEDHAMIYRLGQEALGYRNEPEFSQSRLTVFVKTSQSNLRRFRGW